MYVRMLFLVLIVVIIIVIFSVGLLKTSIAPMTAT